MPIVQTLHNLQKRYQSPAVHLYGVYMVVLLCVIRCDFCHLLTYLLTYFTVQSPSWEANRFAASQEIPRISRNPKVNFYHTKL